MNFLKFSRLNLHFLFTGISLLFLMNSFFISTSIPPSINLSPTISPTPVVVGADNPLDLEGIITFAGSPDRNTLTQIYSIDLRTRKLRQLTFNQMFESYEPDWSFDGEKLVFISASEKKLYLQDIYTITNGRRVRLTKNLGSQSGPRWSPNGKIIAFERGDGEYSKICILSLEKGECKCITRDTFYNRFPTWSPDGKRIAYVAQDRKGKWNIYSLTIDGKEKEMIFSDGGYYGNLSWSPDGRYLAFTYSPPEGKGGKIALLNLETRQLTTPVKDNDFVTTELDPAWSPDGKYLAFSAGTFRPGIYVVGIDGSGLTCLVSGDTDNAFVTAPNSSCWFSWYSENRHPDWKP